VCLFIFWWLLGDDVGAGPACDVVPAQVRPAPVVPPPGDDAPPAGGGDSSQEAAGGRGEGDQDEGGRGGEELKEVWLVKDSYVQAGESSLVW